MNYAITSRPVMQRRWATLEEAAQHARCSPVTIRRRIEEGLIPRRRNGRVILVDLNELDRLIEAGSSIKW